MTSWGEFVGEDRFLDVDDEQGGSARSDVKCRLGCHGPKRSGAAGAAPGCAPRVEGSPAPARLRHGARTDAPFRSRTVTPAARGVTGCRTPVSVRSCQPESGAASHRPPGHLPCARPRRPGL